MCMSKISCYYTLGAINYKNGFVTSCAQQSDYLHIQKETLLKNTNKILEKIDNTIVSQYGFM